MKSEFFINFVVAGTRTHLIGRCGDTPIRPGVEFKVACRYKPRESIAEFALPPTLLESFPVSVHVVEVQAQDRVLDELCEGMTGSLVVIGEDHRITPGLILEA